MAEKELLKAFQSMKNKSPGTGTNHERLKIRVHEMLCAIWYHLYNLENVKNPWRKVTFSKVAG